MHIKKIYSKLAYVDVLSYTFIKKNFLVLDGTEGDYNNSIIVYRSLRYFPFNLHGVLITIEEPHIYYILSLCHTFLFHCIISV